MHKYRLLGKKVLRAQSVKNGKAVAIKCMKHTFENIEEVNSLREIQALRRLSPHPHIVKLYEVLYDQPTGRLALVFELMECNIYEMIKGKKQTLPEQTIKLHIFQLMKAVDHMHKHGIFHRDIKPENLLVSDGILKLADFGSCRGIHSRRPYTEYISTRWYRAPECLLTDGYYGSEMDIWGIGCVLFEVLSLTPLFPGANEADQIDRVHKILGTPDAALVAKFKKYGSTHVDWGFSQWPARPDAIPKMLLHSSKEAIDLVQQMLAYDPEKRITAKDALRHPWFADLREAEKKAKEQADLAKPSAETVTPVASTESVGTHPIGSIPNTGMGMLDPLTGKEAQPVDSKYRQQAATKLTTSPIRIPPGAGAVPKDMSPVQPTTISPQGKEGPPGRSAKSPAALVPSPQQQGPQGTKPTGPSGAVLESGAILFNSSTEKSPAQKAFVKAQGSLEYMSARDRAVQQYVLRPPGGKETAVPQTIPKAVLSPLLAQNGTGATGGGGNLLNPQQLAWHPKPSVLSPISSNAQVRLARPKPALAFMQKESPVPLQLTPIPVASSRSPVDIQLGSPSALAAQFSKLPPSSKLIPSSITHAFVTPQPSLAGKRPGQEMRMESFSERHLPLDRSKLAPIGGGVPQSLSSHNVLLSNIKGSAVTRESSIAAALVRAADYRPKLDALAPPPLMNHHDVHYGRPHEAPIPKGSGYLEHMKRRQQQYVSPYSQKTGANGVVIHPGR